MGLVFLFGNSEMRNLVLLPLAALAVAACQTTSDRVASADEMVYVQDRGRVLQIAVAPNEGRWNNEKITCKTVKTAGQTGSRLQEKDFCITEAQRELLQLDINKYGTARSNVRQYGN